MFLSKNIKPLSLTLGLIALLGLLSQVVSFRPIQDDYFILAAVSQQKFSTLIQSVWELQGGNVFPYAVNGLLLESSKGSVDFLASKIFLFLTAAIVVLVACVFIKWLGIRNRYLIITYISISLLGFEGIFSPLQIAAFSWHQTSVTHLWPIALTILAWEFAGSRKFAGVSLFFCGLVVGNSNSAEALWSIVTTLLYVKTFLRDDEVASKVKKDRLRFFFFGSVLGFTLTLTAPGFWNRANHSVGMPDSIADFGFRLAKSTGAFGFDILTHPYLWLAFLIGFFCKSNIDLVSIFHLRQKRRFLVRSSLLLYILLVFGTTVGYPAWHQPLGLYIVLLPTMFIVGATSDARFLKKTLGPLKIFFYITVIFCLSLSVRSSISVLNRAQQWDSAYHSNICLIHQGDTRMLKGAEMVYPVFQKGIEDIESWAWMKQSYVTWINSQESTTFAACGYKEQIVTPKNSP